MSAHISEFHYPVEAILTSHSSQGQFNSCARKFELSKLFAAPVRTPTLAGSGGNAIHEAAGTYIRTKSRDQSTWEFVKRFRTDLLRSTAASRNWSIQRAYGGLLSILNWIDSQPHLEIAVIDGKQAIEVPFRINIISGLNLPPVVYRGFIDFVIYNRLHNTYHVLDLKTTESNAADFDYVYRYDEQCLPYGLVLERALEHDFSRFEVQYLVQKLGITPPPPQLLPYTKTVREVQEWAQSFYIDLQRLELYMNNQWFPRESKACLAYQNPCKYFNICANRDPFDMQHLLNVVYSPKETLEEAEPWVELDLDISRG